MSKAGDPRGRPLHGRWVVKVDADRCSLCDVCSNHCPSGALRAERVGETMRLYFRAPVCHGCQGGEGCEAICPEQAIERWDRPAAARQEEVLLVEGRLVACSYCGKHFATGRKLDAVERKREGREVVRDYCPVCRREQLVVRFIEETRAPGSKAHYRSARDILRRAGYRDGKRKPPG